VRQSSHGLQRSQRLPRGSDIVDAKKRGASQRARDDARDRSGVAGRRIFDAKDAADRALARDGKENGTAETTEARQLAVDAKAVGGLLGEINPGIEDDRVAGESRRDRERDPGFEKRFQLGQDIRVFHMVVRDFRLAAGVHDQERRSALRAQAGMGGFGQRAHVVEQVAAGLERPRGDRGSPGIDREERRKKLFRIAWRCLDAPKPQHERVDARPLLFLAHRGAVRAGALPADIHNIGPFGDHLLRPVQSPAGIKPPVPGKRIVVDIQNSHEERATREDDTPPAHNQEVLLVSGSNLLQRAAHIMRFIHSVFEKLKRHPKRIVFPDGDDARVLRAAQSFYERDLGVPVLLGKREEIERVAILEKIKLDHVAIINPETSSDLPVFCQRLERLERYRSMGLKDSRAIMTNHNYFAAMMVQYGLADALVGGGSAYGGALLRPLLSLIKPLPHAEVVSGCTIVELEKKTFGDDGVMFFADTGIVPDPTMRQLASIAVQTGLLARQVFGKRPRVALLSFSTKGSARTASAEKVAGAAVLAREMASKIGAEIAVDGEMQADAALDPLIAEKKMGPSLVGGRANVLIFPDLNSGNIAVKLIHYCAAARTFGQLILGLTRPAADISRGADVEEIVCMAALAGLQSIEYRRLYPEQGE